MPFSGRNLPVDALEVMGESGADDRLLKAQQLQEKLKLILEGEERDNDRHLTLAEKCAAQGK